MFRLWTPHSLCKLTENIFKHQKKHQIFFIKDVISNIKTLLTGSFFKETCFVLKGQMHQNRHKYMFKNGNFFCVMQKILWKPPQSLMVLSKNNYLCCSQELMFGKTNWSTDKELTTERLVSTVIVVTVLSISPHAAYLPAAHAQYIYQGGCHPG